LAAYFIGCQRLRRFQLLGKGIAVADCDVEQRRSGTSSAYFGPAPALRFTRNRSVAFVSTSVRSAGISLPRLLLALPAWVAGAELLASAAAERPRAQTAVALRPDAEVAAVAELPASVAVVAGQPHALAVVAWRPDAEAVEVMALRISTRRPQACPGTQVATGALTGKPLALNRQVRWWPLLVSMEMLTALELTQRGRAWRSRELSMGMGLVRTWPHLALASPVSLSPAASW
jgi:hypothetical protein